MFLTSQEGFVEMQLDCVWKCSTFQTPSVLYGSWDVYEWNPRCQEVEGMWLWVTHTCKQSCHQAASQITYETEPVNILPSFEKKHLPRCFKINYWTIIKHTNLRIFVGIKKTLPSKWFSKIAFSCFIGPSIKPSYFLGNFVSWADFLWAKGVEWMNTLPFLPIRAIVSRLAWVWIWIWLPIYFLFWRFIYVYYSNFILNFWFRLFDLVLSSGVSINVLITTQFWVFLIATSVIFWFNMIPNTRIISDWFWLLLSGSIGHIQSNMVGKGKSKFLWTVLVPSLVWFSIV